MPAITRKDVTHYNVVAKQDISRKLFRQLADFTEFCHTQVRYVNTDEKNEAVKIIRCAYFFIEWRRQDKKDDCPWIEPELYSFIKTNGLYRICRDKNPLKSLLFTLSFYVTQKFDGDTSVSVVLIQKHLDFVYKEYLLSKKK